MGSYEENLSVLPEPPNETQPDSVSDFNSNTLLSNLYSASEKQEENLVGDLKNLTLEDNGYEEKNNNNNRNENLQVEWQSGGNSQYPLRPHAGNCTFYLKSGHCKFGYYCKFNHPVRRPFQDKENHQGLAVEEKRQIECKYYRASGGCIYGNSCRYKHSNEDYVLTPLEVNSLTMPVEVVMNEKREKDGSSEQAEQIECKYYLSSGGCKYGKACRYRHSKEKFRYLENSELPPQELNFLGLPIRRLEKECPYYMRTGSCAYGSSCRFNHPDPTAAEESSTFVSDPSGFRDHSQGYYNGSSMSLNKMSDEHLTYLNHNSPFANGMHANSEWNRHQETTNPYLAPSIDKEIKTADISKLHQEQIEVDEFPERPGEPECPHFMKTGYCKFKSVCKFHHPKSRLPKAILSNAGLPLRPDRRICMNYEKSGICKYGISCHFHHPENLVP